MLADLRSPSPVCVHYTNRALKTKGNTPKYGLIFHSSFIGRAKQRNKGRIRCARRPGWGWLGGEELARRGRGVAAYRHGAAEGPC